VLLRKVTDSDGQEPTFGIFGSFWGSPPLRGRDFRRLYPGESFDVFADPSADLPVQLGGRISDAGTYTIRLVYDISGRVEADWATEQGPPDEEALRFLALMPRGRFEAAPVTVTVIEKSK
jgi:hypothetical protein